MPDHEDKYRKITVEKADGTVLVFDESDIRSEPVFLLRAQDKFAAKVVGFYGDLLWAAGMSEASEHAMEHASEMHHWPHQKVPD